MYALCMSTAGPFQSVHMVAPVTRLGKFKLTSALTRPTSTAYSRLHTARVVLLEKLETVMLIFH